MLMITALMQISTMYSMRSKVLSPFIICLFDENFKKLTQLDCQMKPFINKIKFYSLFHLFFLLIISTKRNIQYNSYVSNQTKYIKITLFLIRETSDHILLTR